ncbi:hypothetical protein D3C81_858000 [compost metagenome]
MDRHIDVFVRLTHHSRPDAAFAPNDIGAIEICLVETYFSKNAEPVIHFGVDIHQGVIAFQFIGIDLVHTRLILHTTRNIIVNGLGSTTEVERMFLHRRPFFDGFLKWVNVSYPNNAVPFLIPCIFGSGIVHVLLDHLQLFFIGSTWFAVGP